MGIRGLTTFINNRSHLYFETYELHDIPVVLDGNAVACSLYSSHRSHCTLNDCFGGDYDKFGAVVEKFFRLLFSCNVTPYVVFDGGYETRKMITVIERMKNKIKCAGQLNSNTEDQISVFPMFLSQTFLDIAVKLNVKCVTSDFEADTETANIGRFLNCPVLSNDSDFFIFDVLYIPLSTFEMTTKKMPNWRNPKDFYNYIPCKIYRVDKFLKSFGGMDKRNLPILAVLLGNDYVKISVFSRFYRNLKIQKCHGDQNDQQKRIKSLITWLQNETVESAIHKVLSRYKCGKRTAILNKINNAIKGYNCSYSTYLQYLDIPSVQPNPNLDTGFVRDKNTEYQDLEELEDASTSDEHCTSTESVIDDDESVDQNIDVPDINSIFYERFRRCLYPPCFMDILKRNRYYFLPQIENDELEYAHSVSLEILSAIQKVIRNNTFKKNLTYIARNNNGGVKRYVLPDYTVTMPTLNDIQVMTLTSRRCLLLQILKIDHDFIEKCLNLVPESWHLFIISIKYLIDNFELLWPIACALILCKTYLEYRSKPVRVHPTVKTVEKTFYPTFSKLFISNNELNNFNNTLSVPSKNADYNELVYSKNLLYYFKMDPKMKMNHRLFDRNVIHSMAQFQSCLLHIKHLNSLLNFPFANFAMSDIFNGTFVYNLTITFMKRSNLDDYITSFLQNTPTLLTSFKFFSGMFEKYSQLKAKYVGEPKRRRKRKTRPKKEIADVYVPDASQDSSGEEVLFDPNNKYSALKYLSNNV